MIRLIALACLMVCSLGANAATLILNTAGQLTGASGVNVDGAFYDVSFIEGNCTGVFGGCDQDSDFTFSTFDQARAASQSLLDQVLLDSALGQFDTVPSLTLGCSTSLCNVTTAYDLVESNSTVPVMSASNYTVERAWTVQGDHVSPDTYNTFTNTGGLTSHVFAKWSPSPVPLPAAAWLFISALGGLVVAKRKQLKA